MDLSYVKKLIKLLSESGVDEIEIEEEGKRVRLVKHPNSVPQWTAAHHPGTPGNQSVVHPVEGGNVTAAPPRLFPAAAEPSVSAGPDVVSPPPEPAIQLHEIKSPIVGTFYRSPAPEAAPFVQVGSTVELGTVLCIVEAMKLMNEIESDSAGKIVKILVENGQPVEYDQALFLVEKT